MKIINVQVVSRIGVSQTYAIIQILLILTTLFLLCSNAVVVRRDKSISYARCSVGMLLLIGLITNYNCGYLIDEKALGIYNGLVHSSLITQIFQIFIFIIGILALQFNSFFPRKIYPKFISSLKLLISKLIFKNSFILNKTSGQFSILEYPLVLMFALIGGALMISSSDIITVFLSIELQSYALYVMCTMYKDSEKATSAGLTYFLLGGLSSCFILLSFGLFYANSGNTTLDFMYISNIISILSYDVLGFIIDYGNFTLVVLSVGFLFKMTAAPVHSWSPDVYDGIPTIVTSFVAVFAKISVAIVLSEVINFTANFFVKSINMEDKVNFYYWTITILISSILSLIIGSIAGLTQSRIKRLLAYSTISQMGFILLALAVNTVESVQSFMFYLLQYSIANLNAFITLITMGFFLYLYEEQKNDKNKDKENIDDNIKKDKQENSSNPYNEDNSPIQLISQLQGFLYLNPVLSISFALTLFSFIGIPPLIGFFAKYMVLSSTINDGYIFMTLITVITSAIGAYYYLVIVKQIFFMGSNYTQNAELKQTTLKAILITPITGKKKSFEFSFKDITLSSTLSISVSTLTWGIGCFMFNPKELLGLTNILALNRFK